MKKLLILFSVIYSINNINGQSLRKVANNNYYEGNYAFAADLIIELLKKNPTDNDLKLKLADCYQKLDLNLEAEELYSELIKLPKLTPYHVLSYAKVLAKNENYAKSAEIYSQYTTLNPNDSRGPAFFNAYTNMQNFYQDKERIKLFYTSINSNQSDFAPTYYHNGLVFLSSRNQGGAFKKVYVRDNSAFLDFYFLKDTSKINIKELKFDGSIKTEPNKNIEKASDDNTAFSANDNSTSANFGSTFLNNLKEIPSIINTPADDFSSTLNSPIHEGPLTFNNTFDTVYFTRNASISGANKRNNKKISRLYIYSAVLRNGKWENIVPFEYNSPDFACGHPALSNDNKTLYFVSDMPGGFGGSDIYYCKQVNGIWQKPKNAGFLINSEGNEMFPYLDNDNHLFYCSDGKPGLGGQDIFVAWLNEPEKQPINVGMPINTSYDDFALIYDSKNNTGYFSSNRKRGINDDDIFKFTTKPYSNSIVNVKFANKNNNKELDDLTLSCLNERQITSFKKHSNTSYTFNVKPNTYLFMAYKNIADTVKFNMFVGAGTKDPFQTTIRDTTIFISFLSDSLLELEARNNDKVLSSILYSNDDAFVHMPEKSSLPKAIKLLQENVAYKLKITSYGNPIKDKKLSRKVALNRATAIKNYVTNYGIEPRRIILNWFEADVNNELSSEEKKQRSDLLIVE